MRVTLTKGGPGIGTVSVVDDAPVRGIVDVGIGKRPSSLLIPRYRGCANWSFDEGSAGDPRCDPADAGSVDELHSCKSPS